MIGLLELFVRRDRKHCMLCTQRHLVAVTWSVFSQISCHSTRVWIIGGFFLQVSYRWFYRLNTNGLQVEHKWFYRLKLEGFTGWTWVAFKIDGFTVWKSVVLQIEIWWFYRLNVNGFTGWTQMAFKTDSFTDWKSVVLQLNIDGFTGWISVFLHDENRVNSQTWT